MSEITDPYFKDASGFSGTSPRPCQCVSCRQRRGEGSTEAQSFVARIFSLPTVQKAVYDVEAREIGNAIDRWLSASIEEESK